MVITQGAAMLMLALILGYVLILLGIAAVGTVLWRRGRRRIGLALIILPLLVAVLPWASGQWQLRQARTFAEDLRIEPAALPLAGARVLIIQPDTGECGAICRMILSRDIAAEVHVMDVSGADYDRLPADPWGAIAADPAITRVRTGPEDPDLPGWRPVEWEAVDDRPRADLVILDDQNGWFTERAWPSLMPGHAPPADDRWRLVQAVLVYPGWPVDAGRDAPVLRLVIAEAMVPRLPFATFSSNRVPTLDWQRYRAFWQGYLCPDTGSDCPVDTVY